MRRLRAAEGEKVELVAVEAEVARSSDVLALPVFEDQGDVICVEEELRQVFIAENVWTKSQRRS